MEKNRCPSCGMPYNGRKCRNCLFQPVKTDLTSDSVGEKQTKVSRPSPKDGKKQTSALRSLLGFLVILALIALLLPALRSWGGELEEIEKNHSIVQTADD